VTCFKTEKASRMNAASDTLASRQRWLKAATRLAASTDPRREAPLLGRLDAGLGRFYSDDTLDGRPIRVRFVWTVLGLDHCRWEQAFTADQGRHCETNWVMDFHRDQAAQAAAAAGAGS
jgi:hypothetical protein